MARNGRTGRHDGQVEAGAAERRSGVYRLAERLLDHVLDVTPNFPRDYRYTVGEAMQLRCLELLSRLSEAYRTFDRAGKSEALLKAMHEHDVLRTLMRVANGREWLGMRRFAVMAELSEDIGAQSSAWLDSLKGSNPAPERGGRG